MENESNTTPPQGPLPNGGGVPIPPAAPPVVSPPPITALPAVLKTGGSRKGLAVFLSICLGLFLLDAFISLCDDSLGLFFHTEALSVVRGIIFTFAALAAFGTYIAMAFTPMIPKRYFLPLCLFNPATQLVLIPFMIYFYPRLRLVVWCISVCQVLLGLLLLYSLQGGFTVNWPLVPESRIPAKSFSWRNFIIFAAVNLFVLVPLAAAYIFFCAGMAVAHFSDGFVSIRPRGIVVQERKYARDDGKMIELYPMVHVAESDFYRSVLQSFPTNSLILMEGVSDSKNLLTNKISYKKVATALGLSEQHEGFKPSPAELVRADVDVSQFSSNTLSMLNIAMLVHSKGVTAESLLPMMQFQETPNLQDRLIDDLLTKRNEHLLGEINSHLPETRNIIIPWGAAHMPGIAKEIQKEGFRLQESHDYLAIRFGHHANTGAYEKVK